jgi:hypothetical protein
MFNNCPFQPYFEDDEVTMTHESPSRIGNLPRSEPSSPMNCPCLPCSGRCSCLHPGPYVQNFPPQGGLGDHAYSQPANGQSGRFSHSFPPQLKPTTPYTLDEHFSQFGDSPSFMERLHELFDEFIYTRFGATGPQPATAGGSPLSPVPYPRPPRPQPQPKTGALHIPLSFHGPSPTETPQHKGSSQHGPWRYGPHSTKPNKQYEIRTGFSNKPSFPHENEPWRYPDSDLDYWKCVSI